MIISFTKMSALGNDFIMVDARDIAIRPIIENAEKLCNRNFGIGGDGVILLLESGNADYTMRIINSDGSEAQMCGNGIRCFAKFVEQIEGRSFENLRVETPAGIKTIRPDERGYRVSMGAPIFSEERVPTRLKSNSVGEATIDIDGNTLTLSPLSMGNPHAVLFTDSAQPTILGPKIEKHEMFPDRCNVEFIKVLSPDHIEMRVWERGCGETLACGTGACAAVVAGIRSNRLSKSVTVDLPGGPLYIKWSGEPDADVEMTGAAEIIFHGQIEIHAGAKGEDDASKANTRRD